LPSIVIGRLNEPARVRPTFHQCVSSKLPWLEIDDDLPRFKESECRRLSPANVSLVLKSALAREAGESLADIARTYGVAHITIMRLSPVLRSPEARQSVRLHSPPSADPGGWLPGSLAGGSRETTRGAIGPKMAPNQYQSLVERPRRSAIQPERKVGTTTKRNTQTRPIIWSSKRVAWRSLICASLM
jgi:hypothetical protein